MQLPLATAILYSFLLLLSTTSAHNSAARLEPNEVNITSVISGMPRCKLFAHTLLANAEVLQTYQNNVDGGITLFCPLNDQFKAFLPKFKNMTKASQKRFLEFFAVPYYQSWPMLKSNNGHQKTLANFKFTVKNDGQDVTLKTKFTTAKIIGTLFDKMPLAIHTIDKVLIPEELIYETLVSARAQAPVRVARAPVHASAQAPVRIVRAPVPASAQAPVGNATKGLKERDAALTGESSVDQVPDEDNSVVKVDRVGSCVIVLSLILGILL